MLPSLSPRVVSALLAFLVAFGLFWFLIHRPGLHIGKIRIIGPPMSRGKKSWKKAACGNLSMSLILTESS